MHIYIDPYVYIYTFPDLTIYITHTHTHTYIYTHTHTQKYKYTYIHFNTHKQVYLNTCQTYAILYMYVSKYLARKFAINITHRTH
jgi:hypothetical protein